MSNDPALWSATRQAHAIRSGEISSRDLLEQIIARIERLNPELTPREEALALQRIRAAITSSWPAFLFRNTIATLSACTSAQSWRRFAKMGAIGSRG